MRSTITSKGQTTIPAPIRQHLNLSQATCLEWIIENGTIRVIPVLKDPIAAFRGQAQRHAVENLLAERKRDQEKE